MIKPFRARELQIRIERWFRNYVFSEYFSINKTLEYHEITYDISAYEFYNGDKEIVLSKSNKYLLSLFFIHREKLITQETLVEKIWWHSEKDYEKNLRIKIMRLKEQLKEAGVDSWIHTIRGEWYMFKKNLRLVWDFFYFFDDFLFKFRFFFLILFIIKKGRKIYFFIWFSFYSIKCFWDVEHDSFFSEFFYKFWNIKLLKYFCSDSGNI